jgi:ribonuclease HI
MTLDIYTDCGGATDVFGVGIHMIDHLENEKSFMLKTDIDTINSQFNTKSTGSTGIGEMYAIIKSLELVSKDFEKVNIFTDSDHAFRIFNNQISKKEKNNIIFSKFLNKVKNHKKQFDINVMWIKGHVDVYGNHIADRISEKALKKSTQKNKLFQIDIPEPGKPVKFIQ